MSCREVADAVIGGIRDGYDFILVNFANPDMVGHTGVVSAAVAAVEAVDACMVDILRTVDENDEWVALVTADHGNCEMMIDPAGAVHTAHTTTPARAALQHRAPLARTPRRRGTDGSGLHRRRSTPGHDG